MKFERSELGALFSKLRTAVPEVRAVGTDDAGILLSGSNAYATNLELSVRAGLSKPVEQDVVVPPRGVDFISGTVAPEISIEADKGILTVKSGTARARLNTTPAENYPEFSGPGNDAKRCIVGANDLSWAISKVLYAVSKDDKHPAHRGLCFSRKGEDVLEICALDGYRMAIARINCTADAIAEMIQNAPAVDPASCLNWRTGKPPEHESWFAKFKDTEQWRFGVFETMSDEVLVTVEFPGGERYTTTSHTTDGEWLDSYESIGGHIIAWAEMPAPAKEVAKK